MYKCKGLIFDWLATLTGAGQPLADFQVEYAWPGKGAGPKVIYGGGVVFDQPGDDDLTDGTSTLYAERASVALHIRVQIPFAEAFNGIRSSDKEAERAGREIGRLFAREPFLCGENTTIAIRSGRGDYLPSDDRADSTLSLSIEVSSFVDYREEQ